MEANSTTPAALPSFSKPPLVEVALSVQFEPLQGFHTAHFGLFWAQLRGTFPKSQDQAPLPPFVERFGTLQPPQVQLMAGIGAIMPRCWFLNNDETELVQLQSDRLTHNWRKLDREGASYPRYGSLKNKLEDELSKLNNFVLRESLGQLVPNQCELTYVNHIVPSEQVGSPPDLSRVIVPWRGEYGDSLRSRPENTAVQMSFLIPGVSEQSTPAGRLYISAQPYFRAKDYQPLLLLQIVCRGAPLSRDSEGAFRFLDLAHEQAVHAFVSVTSPKLQSVWGRVG